MRQDQQSINKILIITLSNLGDVLLTTPVVYTLRKQFPNSRISVMVGPRAKEVFENDPFVNEIIIFDKKSKLSQKLKLAFFVKKENFDMIVDLRNTLFGAFSNAKIATPILIKKEKGGMHMIDVHLSKLKLLEIDTKDAQCYISVGAEEEKYVDGLLEKAGLKTKEGFVVISPGAKSHIKRWTISGFAAVCDIISEKLEKEVILVGTAEDRQVINSILEKARTRPFDFCLKTNFKQLACLIKRSCLLITNDSAPLHLAACLGKPVVAIFGPTDPNKYGPIGINGIVIKSDLHCMPCQKALCRRNHECMNLIKAQEVFNAAKEILL